MNLDIPDTYLGLTNWRRYARWHVEIRDGDTWNHIHREWEYAYDETIARDYLARVRADHPGEQVRLVKTERVSGLRPDGSKGHIDGAATVID